MGAKSAPLTMSHQLKGLEKEGEFVPISEGPTHRVLGQQPRTGKQKGLKRHRNPGLSAAPVTCLLSHLSLVI